ncbi:ADP-ribosylation factor (macronuclear) [Tetrahymena thermophila SB210]|uniref:ADP-ribosylation factor n=1 Tax=Tetrahymena thermophila (strain SB210) TaxID=312017 RepID=Q226B9_TETTS|nr:ADP-ribosylation factor [Tetrahymena thermophila SB210]EAR81135.2 ADP-ribosylation factor [Tetrahymena thermophila SB210]|eukprot:XP_001028798.2 ADP-ribosylation factor [Tetrahymena thermophila SB210]
MLGVNASGRTTMLYKLKTGQTLKVNPTVGFNVEEIMFKDKVFNFMDVGGGYKIYDNFHKYAIGSDAIIIVVDSSYLSYEFYENLLQNTLKSCLQELVEFKKNKKIPILILANKTDKSHYTDEEIIQYTSIDKYQDITFFKLIRTNCFTGQGLPEALQWIYENVQK